MFADVNCSIGFMNWMILDDLVLSISKRGSASRDFLFGGD